MEKLRGGGNGGKIIIQRLNKKIYCQEILYKAHGADASKADYVSATTLTADRQQVMALLVVNCVKFHSTLFKNTYIDFSHLSC